MMDLVPKQHRMYSNTKIPFPTYLWDVLWMTYIRLRHILIHGQVWDLSLICYDKNSNLLLPLLGIIFMVILDFIIPNYPLISPNYYPEINIYGSLPL